MGPTCCGLGPVEAEADLSSLINGPVIIERITVRDARLELAHSAGNESIWAIFESAVDGPEPVDGGPRVLLRRAELSNVDLHITRPERPAPLDVHIRSGSQDVDDHDVVSASLNATANGREVSASGRLETWSTLLDRGRIDYGIDIRLDSLVRLGIKGNLGQTTVDARGSFSELQDLDDVEVTARANDPDLGRMLTLFSVERPRGR